MMNGARFAPDFSLSLNGQPAPAELRASIKSVHARRATRARRVEVALANEKLRWLDSELLKVGTG